jgi:hypothetical protein
VKLEAATNEGLQKRWTSIAAAESVGVEAGPFEDAVSDATHVLSHDAAQVESGHEPDGAPNSENTGVDATVGAHAEVDDPVIANAEEVDNPILVDAEPCVEAESESTEAQLLARRVTCEEIRPYAYVRSGPDSQDCNMAMPQVEVGVKGSQGQASCQYVVVDFQETENPVDIAGAADCETAAKAGEDPDLVQAQETYSCQAMTPESGLDMDLVPTATTLDPMMQLTEKRAAGWDTAQQGARARGLLPLMLSEMVAGDRMTAPKGMHDAAKEDAITTTEPEKSSNRDFLSTKGAMLQCVTEMEEGAKEQRRATEELLAKNTCLTQLLAATRKHFAPREASKVTYISLENSHAQEIENAETDPQRALEEYPAVQCTRQGDKASRHPSLLSSNTSLTPMQQLPIEPQQPSTVNVFGIKASPMAEYLSPSVQFSKRFPLASSSPSSSPTRSRSPPLLSSSRVWVAPPSPPPPPSSPAQSPKHKQQISKSSALQIPRSQQKESHVVCVGANCCDNGRNAESGCMHQSMTSMMMLAPMDCDKNRYKDGGLEDVDSKDQSRTTRLVPATSTAAFLSAPTASEERTVAPTSNSTCSPVALLFSVASTSAAPTRREFVCLQNKVHDREREMLVQHSTHAPGSAGSMSRASSSSHASRDKDEEREVPAPEQLPLVSAVVSGVSELQEAHDIQPQDLYPWRVQHHSPPALECLPAAPARTGRSRSPSPLKEQRTKAAESRARAYQVLQYVTQDARDPVCNTAVLEDVTQHARHHSRSRERCPQDDLVYSEEGTPSQQAPIPTLASTLSRRASSTLERAYATCPRAVKGLRDPHGEGEEANESKGEGAVGGLSPQRKLKMTLKMTVPEASETSAFFDNSVLSSAMTPLVGHDPLKWEAEAGPASEAGTPTTPMTMRRLSSPSPSTDNVVQYACVSCGGDTGQSCLVITASAFFRGVLLQFRSPYTCVSPLSCVQNLRSLWEQQVLVVGGCEGEREQVQRDGMSHRLDTTPLMSSQFVKVAEAGVIRRQTENKQQPQQQQPQQQQPQEHGRQRDGLGRHVEVNDMQLQGARKDKHEFLKRLVGNLEGETADTVAAVACAAAYNPMCLPVTYNPMCLPVAYNPMCLPVTLL